MITIDGVTKKFRKTTVLDNLSLDFGKGDRIALIGSNGAGKTTLIRCILGQYIHSGTVSVNGLESRRNREKILGEIGFVPQIAPPLKMPVGELLRFCAGTAGIGVEAIVSICEHLEIEYDEFKKRPFNKLSGGQKQKILIAIAMARKPELIILDEPTANLDPHARQILFEMLSERGDLPVLISSHRLEEVAGLVNRIIELDRGRVVLDDAVEDGGEMSARIDCRITLARTDDAFANTISGWKFSADKNQTTWKGQVAGADRLRFFGVLARYSGLVDGLEMGSKQEKRGDGK
ncbi:MAG: ABC transporter ATP-binding protein [Hyphomicrobiales bacterium]|nr:ABC transporter ATP-binding protein [Hyphomicrobiales bacterium]